jgi:hypothetical protein
LVILIAVYPALVYAGPDPAVELEYTFPEPMLEKVAF